MTDQEPKTVGDYAIRGFLGEGAFGRVYAAQNCNSREWRAVKVVPTERGGVAELKAITKCANEIRDHPHLMPIFHVGWLDDQREYYFVMPLADDSQGRSTSPPPKDYHAMTLLRHVNRRGPLPVSQVLTIGDRLMVGLKRLHSSGLVHCDIKPANVVRHNGKWRLSDFGIAVHRNRDAGGPGTPWFLAPEGSGDFAGDVYALGKTLFLLATDLHPSTGHDPIEGLRRGATKLPFRDERNDKLTALILDACAERRNERLMLDDFHLGLVELMDRYEVKIEFTEDISAEDLRSILEANGLTPGSIELHQVTT